MIGITADACKLKPADGWIIEGRPAPNVTIAEFYRSLSADSSGKSTSRQPIPSFIFVPEPKQKRMIQRGRGAIYVKAYQIIGGHAYVNLPPDPDTFYVGYSDVKGVGWPRYGIAAALSGYVNHKNEAQVHRGSEAGI